MMELKIRSVVVFRGPRVVYQVGAPHLDKMKVSIASMD